MKENMTSSTLNTEPVVQLNLFPDEGYADPHVLVDNGTLYVVCGHDKSPCTETTWVMDWWDVFSTTDLINWKKEYRIKPTDTYIGDSPNCWAGDIIKKDDKYYWYFSNRNLNTGVMVSDSPTGPYVDALNKPLLPTGIVGDISPYDPCIYKENGAYTIFFGCGTYFAATLNDDMISLADEPVAIQVFNKDGNIKRTDDKSTVFKRNNIYYLLWGSHYATSNNLKGPYTYQGEFLKSSHNSVFQWHGQWYLITENIDISIFYRGITLKPLNFNDDGTINTPANDLIHPVDGREWSFSHSNMGFHTPDGMDVLWCNSGKIHGDANKLSIIESAIWPITNLEEHSTLILNLKNETSATQARISVASIPPIYVGNAFWTKPEIDWQTTAQYIIDITPNSNKFIQYQIDLSKNSTLQTILKRLRVEPCLNVNKGHWEINTIAVK